jgi:uncharacterized protein YbgA (DUF1722 family)/uncharacterized protein YbbK (DUF523 family)
VLRGSVEISEKFSEKPVVVVSKCIEFEPCRYNGQMISDRFVSHLKRFVTFIPVCPEVEIGLGTPRPPIRIVSTGNRKILFQPQTGRDVTEKMESFISRYLDGLDAVDGFILKYRSPSCGPRHVKVYSGLDGNAPAFFGSGFFGGAVMERFPHLAVEDEGRLKNFAIREHFLTRIFTRARFRRARKKGMIREMVDFHSAHKYLFMAYNQSRLKNLGRIVASHKKHGYDEVVRDYEEELHAVLGKAPNPGRLINVLLHLFGGVSDKLSGEERKFFLDSIEEYRDERIPLSVLLILVESWAVRFQDEFLLGQVILKPYPAELLEVTDSGKGREFR